MVVGIEEYNLRNRDSGFFLTLPDFPDPWPFHRETSDRPDRVSYDREKCLKSLNVIEGGVEDDMESLPRVVETEGTCRGEMKPSKRTRTLLTI